MKRDAQARGRFRRHQRGPIAHGHDAIERSRRDDLLDRFGGILETHGNGVVAPGIVEHVAAVGGERDVHAELPRGVREDADLVAGGGGDEQQAGHTLSFANCRSRMVPEFLFPLRQWDRPELRKATARIAGCGR